MERKINYILATWGQKRQDPLENYPYLVKHIEQLNKVQHGFSQVTIGRPHCPNELLYYSSCIDNLKSLDDGTPIVVHEMQNSGMSYGQYSRIFDIYRDQFTHYFFMEDDYVPVEDHFDTTLAEMFDQIENCGLLCGLVFDKTGRFGCHKKHAAVSNGISSSKVLKTIWEKHGCLPNIQRPSQMTFSQAFLNSGFTIDDYVDEYRTLYFQHDELLRVYGDKFGKDIIIPIQCLEKKEWKFIEFTKKSKSKSKAKVVGTNINRNGNMIIRGVKGMIHPVQNLFH